MSPAHAVRALAAIVAREGLRFLHQRVRLLAALVRPLVWLVIFGAGLRGAVALGAVAPYDGTPAYDVYIVPGLVAMVQLFNGMQSSLSMVYDREMGSMRVLLVAPLPRWYLLFCKLLAGTLVSLVQVAAFLAVAALAGVVFPPAGYVAVLPVLLLSGLMVGALGLLLSSLIRQLENFAGVMNFVIFPLFFLSTALYPLSRLAESSALLAALCQANPFTHAVEALRFAFYLDLAPLSLAVLAAACAAFFAAAVYGYDPARGFMARKGGGAG